MLLGLLASGLAFLAGPVSFQAPATQSLHWLDLEGDGVLDALTVDGAGRVALFQNQGDGTFVDRTAAFGLEGQVRGPGRALRIARSRCWSGTSIAIGTRT